MDIITHHKNGIQIAEVLTNTVFINTADDGAQLLHELYYQGFDGIILKTTQLSPDFFDLKTGLAGEILQKFSNRRTRLTIIGDFDDIESKSLRDFIFESNKGKLINFVTSVDDALGRF